MRMQVPSPWLTSSTKRVVKTVWAVESEAKVVARPSVKRKGEYILGQKMAQASPSKGVKTKPKKDVDQVRTNE
jgi:hypothetical protein